MRVWRLVLVLGLLGGGGGAQPLPPVPPRVVVKHPVVRHPVVHRGPVRRVPVRRPVVRVVPRGPVVAVPVPVVPAPVAVVPAAPDKGSVTGFPLPRFASLRTGDVNLRAGPGTRYPIEWVYKRRDLPVEIEREFDVWRLVRLQDGTRGWLQQATIWGRRTFVVTGGEHAVRRGAEEGAAVMARVEPGVVGRVMACGAGADWCRVEVGAYKGWMKREDFWGTLPGEAVQ